jgi:hypothetical protein
LLAKRFDVFSGLHLHFPPIRWGVKTYVHSTNGEKWLQTEITPPDRQSEGGFLLPSEWHLFKGVCLKVFQVAN